ncbi:MAG: cytosine/adenosine deaminase-related metal-dependent hydrolase [Pseudohongiellaceae bacterium]|jgi:cytosine/adenosine deaminase-related metal-dependent hydrolase
MSGDPWAELPVPAVNGHTHLYSGLVPLGMPPAEPAPADFLAILKQVWWRLDRALDAESIAASARYYVANALLLGTTGLIDHHESPECLEGSLDLLADPCQELGMPAVLCFGATERNGGPEEGRRGLAECRRFIESNRRPLVRGVVGLHASFTASDETLRAAGALARELATVVHVHVAEDRADVEDAVARGYRSPLHRLLACDALPAGSILAHGVHMSPEEVAVCNDRGFWLVHNPRSNEGNGVGWAGALTHGDRVALGTDGWESNLLDEVAAGQRLGAESGEGDGAAFSGRLDQGAALLSERFGSAGAPQVTRSEGSLTIGERLVVVDGQLATGDLDAIRADAERSALALWKRMAGTAC